jgi:hypothetical protein
MSNTAQLMDLMGLVQAFLKSQQSRLKRELAAKYDVPEDELSDNVSDFLKKAYGPAEELISALSRCEHTVVLFIGRKGCAICQKSQPGLERFLKRHGDVKLVKLDYSDPRGMLYHILHQEKTGMLPLIAMISEGQVKMIFTGECILPEAYEKYYNSIKSDYHEENMCAT